VVFNLYPMSAYDPASGETVKGTVSQYVKKVIPPSPVEERYIDGDLIRSGDLWTGAAALNIEFTPEPGIEVMIDNQTWKVVQVKPVYANEKMVLYNLQLRK